MLTTHSFQFSRPFFLLFMTFFVTFSTIAEDINLEGKSPGEFVEFIMSSMKPEPPDGPDVGCPFENSFEFVKKAWGSN